MESNLSEHEKTLIEALSKGNVLAFNTLFKEYSGKLYRFVYGYLKSEFETEELVQEVFTIIWEKREKLKCDLSFKSFIFKIAFNCILKYFRSKKYHNSYIKSNTSNDVDNLTSQTIDRNSLDDYLTDLINLLPNRRKEIYIRSRVSGQSIKDISEALNLSHKTVENQLSSALSFLRKRIESEGF